MIMIKIISEIKELFKVNIIKTLYFNFKYFPIKQAIKLPFLIYPHTRLELTKGQILLNCKIRFGLVRFGPKILGIVDEKYVRTIWEVTGEIVVNGQTLIGQGCKLSVIEGTLVLGDNFAISGNSAIICNKDITFGNDCLLSWDILIMDSDIHSILDRNGNRLNLSIPIKIGNHVWIGCRSTILKGVNISNDCVIAASSVLTKSFDTDGVIIGGHGSQQRILKENITWCLDNL